MLGVLFLNVQALEAGWQGCRGMGCRPVSACNLQIQLSNTNSVAPASTALRGLFCGGFGGSELARREFAAVYSSGQEAPFSLQPFADYASARSVFMGDKLRTR